MTKIILASTSLARQYLLKKAGINDFITKKPLFDEENAKDQIKSWPIKEQALFLAEKKGEDIAKQFPNHFVISSDQICCLDNQIIHKSKDQADAIKILQKLNGKTHIQNNATCLFENGKIKIKHYSPANRPSVLKIMARKTVSN